MADIPTHGTLNQDTAHYQQKLIENLVRQYHKASIPARQKRSMLNNLVKTDLQLFEKWIDRAFEQFQELSATTGSVSLLAEWILDNHYIIQQAIVLIEEDLSPGYLAHLKTLIDPPYENFPRIFAIIRALLSYHDYYLEIEDLQEHLIEFQKEVPLTMSELWSIPIFIRFGLIEKLASILIKEIKTDSPLKTKTTFPPLLETMNLRSSEEQKEDPNSSEIVGNIVRSLRVISETDWEENFESISLVEKSLRLEPAGIYPRMDFKTRDIYRSEIEKIARLSGFEENQLATLLIEMSGNNETPIHIGSFLIGERRKEFEILVGFKPGIKAHIRQKIKELNTQIYLGSTGLIAVILILIVLLLIHQSFGFESVGFPQILIMIAITLSFIPPALIVANNLVNLVLNSILLPSILPKMQFKRAIPPEYKTLVVIPGMISCTGDIENLVQQLEIHYLSNPQPGLKFALLTDFSDAHDQNQPEDESHIQEACKAIEKLDQKYQLETNADERRFFLFHRKRLWNPSQKTWMGWERKRGKLNELNRFLRGADDTSFLPKFVSNDIRNQLGYIKYIITVDADTILPPGSAARLVGAIAHPLNQARIDPILNKVTSGYTILQPRVETNPRSANQTWFTRIFAGDTGLDLYSHAVSDIYQDLFDEGIYAGKGIYDLDSMIQSVDVHIPENTLLSHDLFEGILGRTALTSDITVIEDYPLNYYEQVSRQRRWIRGDWQLLPWLLRPAKLGVRFSAIDYWKIIHNLLRSLLSPALIITYLLGIIFVPNLAWLWTTSLIVSFGVPLFSALVKRLQQNLQRMQRKAIWPSLWPVFMRWVFAIAFLPYEAYYAIDAVVITLRRVFITHRKLLTWTTAEHASELFRSKKMQDEAWIKLSTSAFIIVIIVLIAQAKSLISGGTTILLQMPVLPVVSLWLLSSVFVNFVNLPLPLPKNEAPFKDISFLRLIARRTWNFFDRFVGPQDSWLPPDHFQESPNPMVAHHTSPSNIGLFLTSAIGAYDLGYFDQLDLAARLETTFGTLMRMERYLGHFLNWYNTQTLEPLSPRYISTVDSGNLAISLVIVSQTCKTITGKRVFRREIWEGYMDNLTDLLDVLQKIKKDHPPADVNTLNLSINAMLAKIRAVKNIPLEWYPTYTNIGSVFWPALSKRLMDFIAHLPARIELEDITGLQEVIQGIEKNYNAIQSTIDELVPWISFFEKIPMALQQNGLIVDLDSLKNLLTYNPRLYQIPQIVPSARKLIKKLQSKLKASINSQNDLKLPVEEATTWLSGLEQALTTANDNAVQLQIKFKTLEDQSDQFIEDMDFSFLYNSMRNVFHIGYNLESGKLDNSFYDLLASEARIASIFALSRSQVPQAHWLHLDRPITRVKKNYALLSWSATMFEYLMPTLYFHPHVNTLLNTSAMTMVNYQRDFAKSKNIPWGVSESGFYQFDANMNYQYRAFGMPALGFKRGLADDLVVTPYASLLAIQFAPSSVEENIHDLIAHNAFGPYGFYEAVDFTSDRLRPGRKFEVVKEYMSHHQGMILMAIVNYLRSDIMIRRVFQDPKIKSVENLLHEQMPIGIPLMMPGEHETRGTRRVPEIAAQIEPWQAPITSSIPQIHLLSNGSFSTLLTNRGAGFSRWKNLDLTRWHADAVLDPSGTWIYIQDMQKGDQSSDYPTWSATHQPLPGSAKDSQVNFFAHMAVFRRTENDLTSTMEVTVAPEEPLEIRRLHLINNSAKERRLRITSYGEVILNQQTTDTRHPAYNKLFIESEYIPELNLLIFTHRKINGTDEQVFFGHMLVIEKSRTSHQTDLPVKFETDRRAFIGRDRNLHNPYALQSETYLTGSKGSTLDPIFSLGREIHLRPHKTFSLAYVTFAASNRNALLKLAERYQSWVKIENTFHEANHAKQIWLGQRKIGREAIRSSLDLLSLLVYPVGQKRATPEILSRNTLNQSGLWRFGVSGDYPIILLEIDEAPQLNLLIQVVRAQNFLRLHGYNSELIVLNSQPSMYSSELTNLMMRRIRLIGADQWVDQRKGIFIRSADQMLLEEQVLLRSIARVLLNGKDGSLSEQLLLTPSAMADLPALFTTQASRRDLPVLSQWMSTSIDGLQFFNGYGGFSADGREYVMHLPPGKTTPAPWVNVIGYPHFGFMVSQAGSQTTWSINSGENRISPWSNDPVSDPSGEVMYLRDEETGDIWTPTPLPTPAPQAYRVRHGAGYSVFESESYGLQQEMTVFASPDDPIKIVHLKLKNMLRENRRITATYYLEWVLGLTHEDTYPMLFPEYDPDRTMLRVRNTYHPEMGNQIIFLMTNRAPHGFTTDRLEFLGSTGSIKYPAALHRIGLSNKVAIGSDTAAAMQMHMDLPAEGMDEIYFVIGDARNEEESIKLAQKYRDPSMVARTLEKTHKFWENLLTRVQVKTPDPAANLMLNQWWLYQALSCRIWGRSGFYQSSGAFGFRDQLQDVLALLNIKPTITRDQILNAARHQFKEGDVLHWWHPPTGRGVRTRISDNLLWLPYVTMLYVEATGDFSVWEEKMPFLAAAPLRNGEMERYAQYDWTVETFTLFEHCRRAVLKGATTGAHGLPLIGSGDWNDGFNKVGSQGKGESIWLAWFLADVLNRFAQVSQQRGLQEEAEVFQQQANSYVKAIEENAWDGDWYLRAFYDDGTPLGSHLSEECQIDAIAQSWAILSDAGDRDRSSNAMNKVWERLTDPDNNLSLLFTPPFDKTNRNPGYIKDYPPGVRENGGQYSHAAAWTTWAFAKLGDSTRAWHLFDMLNPIYQSDREERAAQYHVEPYVSAADVYSQGSQLRRGGWTWYTGSAAWLYRVGVEALLGLRIEGKLLQLSPVIPARWDGYSISYRYHNTLYLIEAKNPDHVSSHIREIWLDGDRLDQVVVELADDGIDHHLNVILGK